MSTPSGFRSKGHGKQHKIYPIYDPTIAANAHRTAPGTAPGFVRRGGRNFAYDHRFIEGDFNGTKFIEPDEDSNAHMRVMRDAGFLMTRIKLGDDWVTYYAYGKKLPASMQTRAELKPSRPKAQTIPLSPDVVEANKKVAELLRKSTRIQTDSRLAESYKQEEIAKINVQISAIDSSLGAKYVALGKQQAKGIQRAEVTYLYNTFKRGKPGVVAEYPGTDNHRLAESLVAKGYMARWGENRYSLTSAGRQACIKQLNSIGYDLMAKKMRARPTGYDASGDGDEYWIFFKDEPAAVNRLKARSGNEALSKHFSIEGIPPSQKGLYHASPVPPYVANI